MYQIQKKYICLVIALMLLSSTNLKSQSITYNIIPPTCASCCNGSFTMTVLYTTSFAFYSTPTLAVTSWSVNVLTFNNVCTGTYSIHITGSELYGDYDDVVTIGMPTLVESNSNIKDDLKLFPNPTKDYVQIKLDATFGKKSRIVLQDINGKVIENLKLQDRSELILDTSFYDVGIYFMTLYQDNRILERRKLVVLR